MESAKHLKKRMLWCICAFYTYFAIYRWMGVGLPGPALFYWPNRNYT
jgi:hypothetical protein